MSDFTDALDAYLEAKAAYPHRGSLADPSPRAYAVREARERLNALFAVAQATPAATAEGVAQFYYLDGDGALQPTRLPMPSALDACDIIQTALDEMRTRRPTELKHFQDYALYTSGMKYAQSLIRMRIDGVEYPIAIPEREDIKTDD